MLKHAKSFVPASVKHHINAYVSARISSAMAPLDNASFRIPFWYEWNYWEPNVMVALRDLIKPGETVYDVGANAGALSLAMSRAAGPRGIVCSFEASPRIVGKCQYNLATNGANNVTLYHNAVYSKSREIMKIYQGDHLNDSLVHQGSAPEKAALVETITLDDFSAHYDLKPSLIKMDIEGAEFEALKGSTRILEECRPHLLLEQQPSDTSCLDMLRGLGYRAIDLCNLNEVTGKQDFDAGIDVANILYVHSTRIAETKYNLPLKKELVAELGPRDFVRAGAGFVSKPLSLAPGRYFFDNEFEAEGRDNEAFFGLEANGNVIFRYHTYTRFHASSYRDWVADVGPGGPVTIFSRFLNGTSDPTLKWKGSKVYRIPSLSRE